MSEYVFHDEFGPFFSFQSNMGIVVGRLATAGLFTFEQEHAGVDHLFVQLSEDGDSMTGPYLFRVAFDKDPPMFQAIVDEVRDAGFTEVHADVPSEQDQAVFDHFIGLNFVEKVTNKKIKKWLDE